MKAIRTAVTLTALLASAAWAAPRDPRVNEKHEPGNDRDVEVKLQGGVTTYTGEAASLTTPGISYGVAAAMDLVGMLDGELSYQGAAYGTDARLGTRNTIVENGGQAVLMLSPTYGRIEPYALAGLAITRLNVTGTETNPAPGVRDATTWKLPVGVGLDFVPNGDGGGEMDLLIGARVQYDVALGGSAFPTLSNEMSTNQLLTTVHFGASF